MAKLQWNFFRFCSSTLRQEESVKNKVACKRSLSFIFAATDYCKNLRWLSDLLFLSIFFYRVGLSFLLRYRETRKYITFSSSFTSAYFLPTRYSMFVVHLSYGHLLCWFVGSFTSEVDRIWSPALRTIHYQERRVRKLSIYALIIGYLQNRSSSSRHVRRRKHATRLMSLG